MIIFNEETEDIVDEPEPEYIAKAEFDNLKNKMDQLYKLFLEVIKKW